MKRTFTLLLSLVMASAILLPLDAEARGHHRGRHGRGHGHHMSHHHGHFCTANERANGMCKS